MKEVFEGIAKATSRIAEALAYDDTGYSDNKNATGDVQLKLDIKSDYIVEEELARIPTIKALASEEQETVHTVNSGGQYLIGYDPLDGSSLAGVNLAVGSIFGIYENSFIGANLIAASYVIYGPRIEMVTAYKHNVELWRQDNSGEFKFVQTLRLRESGTLVAPGGTQQHWYPHHKRLVDQFFSEGYRLRYSGGMVPDLHQILIKGGGIYSYPGTTDKPGGKIRLVFESMPFAKVFEMAGGAALDDMGKRLLDGAPSSHHATSPCFIGSTTEVERAIQAYGSAA
ncbi:MAG: class 1 fructose-bisphosphatase [Helicobacteraceae bacterium]|jgi:fructose-1,6-bisphosphatase I|nr:class 1 fructose-bisphosphatase [Helicobacteraceae bacterium]